jgi:hypothetical protein
MNFTVWLLQRFEEYFNFLNIATKKIKEALQTENASYFITWLFDISSEDHVFNKI